MKFQLESRFKPTGDQPNAIKQITKNLKDDVKSQVLLGVTGSGKSVVANTTVLVKDYKGIIREEKIGAFIDNILSIHRDKIVYAEDSEIVFSSMLPTTKTYETYSFDPTTKKSSWKKILQFVRHLSPKTLCAITTDCGREIVVTDNHSVYTLKKGDLALLHTNQIDNSFYLPLPRVLPSPKEPITFVELSSFFPTERKLYLTVPNFSSFTQDHQALYLQNLSPSQRFQIKHGGRISFDAYSKLSSFKPSLIDNAIVGTYGKEYHMLNKLQTTNSLMRLLGYYIAEGHAEAKYFVISSASSEIINDFHQSLDELGLKHAQRPDTYDYQISSTFWSELLTIWCGNRSSVKKLPPFWMNLSQKKLASLLSAYFTADGGVNGLKISACTASKQLASDIMYALLRFGIIARINKRNIKVPNSSKRNLYYVISISGKESLTIFLNDIGFIIEEKRGKLSKIIKDKTNTNVDLMPINGAWIKETRIQLALSQKEISHACNITRSHISLLENNLRKPSRSCYNNILSFFEKTAIHLNKLDLLNSIENQQSLLQLYWTKVNDITVVNGEQYVYDFAVAENETFLAGMGGMYVHNTFTMANVIQEIQKPTLIISHNKTLAGQLYQEFRDFFPNNAVSYFVSYYDYYQPEAYVPTTDTYIEKESEINEEIDKLRLAATANLLTRKDVIVVASVSCIYNIGSPVEYGKFVLELKQGVKIAQQDILIRLADLQYDRNDYEFKRGAFRVRGNAIDLFPAYVDHGIRIEVSDRVTNMYEFDPLTGDILKPLDATVIYPAKHYMTDPRSYHDAFAKINADVDKQVKKFREQNKLIEAQRIAQRTHYDLEMLREIGYVNGIENYSIYFDNRPPGSPPYSLIDYFQAASDDWLLLVDESHITLPQIRGMYNGDQARKQTLIDYGFRLPSALDNRPLKFDEFMRKTNQIVYVSATPNDYELSLAQESDHGVVEQLIRPTGLVDPVVTVKPSAGQIADLLEEIKKRVEKKQRVLVTTLTKRMSEELTSYLEEHGVKVAYLHSDIETLNRQDVLDNLRSGEHDVVVGINLLREGLDLPEVSLVAILDADKEGFLRSRTSLIQTMGRAARNVDAEVIMYADTITKSMEAAIGEGERRRKIQLEYNEKHGITPQTIIKDIRAKLVEQQEEEGKPTIDALMQFSQKDVLLPDERQDLVKNLRKEMKIAAERLDFETAIAIRDQIRKVKKK